MLLTLRYSRKLRLNKRPSDSNLMYFTSTQGYTYSVTLHQSPLLQSTKSLASFLLQSPCLSLVPPYQPNYLPCSSQEVVFVQVRSAFSLISTPSSLPKLCTLTGCLLISHPLFRSHSQVKAPHIVAFPKVRVSPCPC